MTEDEEARRVEELERVLLRLGLTDDEKLCDVLRLLLPQLFRRLVDTPSSAICAKILETLNHLVKRLKTLPTVQIQLPVMQLLEFLDVTPPVDAANDNQALHCTYARNFALLFVEMGFTRTLSKEDRMQVLVHIVCGISSKSSQFQDVVGRLFLHAFLWQDTIAFTEPNWSVQDANVLLDFFLDVLLFPSESALTASRKDRLSRCKVSTLEAATRTDVQFKIVQFLKNHASSVMKPSMWYIHMGVGAAADYHTVATFCQEELSRLHKYHLELLDTEDCMGQLCNLILGSKGDGSSVLLAERHPLPDLVVLAIIPLLLQAKAVADAFPFNLQLICTLLFGDSPSRPRVVKANIRKAGIDLTKWVLGLCNEALLVAALGPVLFSPLMKLLSEDDETVNHEIKVGVYAAFSTLARRAPTLIGSTAETFQRLMYRAMVEEEKRSGSACLEALRAVSVAYVGGHVSVTVIDTIKRELRDLSTSSKVLEPKFDRVRGVLAHWAYEMQCQEGASGRDLDMRLVCIRFAGDANETVRTIAVKAIYQEPLPSFAATIEFVLPHIPTVQATVRDHALKLCLASLKADPNPEALVANDIQALIDCCTKLLELPQKSTAVETLVQLSQMKLGVLNAHVDRIRDLMLHDSDDLIREQMAILLASVESNPAQERWIQELTMVLKADGSSHTEQHGAVSGLAMLVRQTKNQDAVIAITQAAKVHLGKMKQAAILTNHDYKWHSQMLLATVQALGAIGNLLDLNLSPEEEATAMSVLLEVLDLVQSSTDSTDMTLAIKTRTIQSLGRLMLGLTLSESPSVDRCVDKLLKLAETRDAAFQFHVANVFAALGFVVSVSNDYDSNNRVKMLLDRILQEGIAATSPHIRNSAAIWLFGIVSSLLTPSSFCQLSNEWTNQLLPLSLELHEVLVDLLNELSTLTQECAVKSLVILYNLATPEFANEMSDSLFKRLKCFRAFVDPAANVANDAATNTIENACYREVSNVAAEVGDASVMYTLLYLSTSDPMWGILLDSTSTSTTIANIIRSSLNVTEYDRGFGASQAQKAHFQWHASAIATLLVPRLFLLKSHPNPKIGNCMVQLWKIMVGADEKAVTNKYYIPILTYALQRLEHSRNFKYREAACVAIVDLLNGRGADDVREHLGQIWKLTTRAVDDVNEMVVIAGIKLIKCVGELSLRVAAADVQCLDQVLPFLVNDGIVANNKLCQALCMGYLLRLIKSIPPHHLKSYLATLPVTLLQCMSSLEMPELQYAQFHVQDKRQLEKLRVSLSQAGPVGELLQACLSQLSQLSSDQGCTEIVKELCDGVCTVLKSGVGLNTRVGSANFVASLVTEVALEMRQSGGAEKLLCKIFVPYITQTVLNETHDFYNSEEVTQEDGLRDGLVVRAYCRAAAYVAKLVPSSSSSVVQYVRGTLVVPTTIVFADSASTTEKGFGRYGWVTVTALQELLQQLPPSQSNPFDWCIDVFRVAFVGQFSSQPLLSAAWKVVLESIPPTMYYSLVYAETTLAYACDLLSHLSWESRKQGASAIMKLSSGEYVRWIRDWLPAVKKIKTSIPGRLWRGKGLLLEALGCTYAFVNDDAQDTVNILVEECDRALRNKDIAYLESALISLGTLAKTPSLESFATLKTFFFESSVTVDCPPLIYKRMFETLTKWWPDQQDSDDATHASETLAWLCNDALSKYQIWSVREAIFGVMQHVVSLASWRSLINRKTISSVIATCQAGAEDPKFAAVRRAALLVLSAAVSRREPMSNGGGPLVSVVAYKEDLVQVATKASHDTEPLVCQAASQLLNGLTQQ
ncbi:unnamed protein product [Aphanomyces euteiches]